MARAFARHHKGNARLIIIARNKVAADELIASLPSPAKDLSEFVYCEASLMRNIDAACAQLAERDVDKINYLVLSVGEFVAYKRELTEEGLDRNLAPAFFGRFRWTQNLAPMLDRAAESGEEAKVMTVALGGKGGTIDWDDLDMTSNMLSRMSSELPTYMDLSFRALAKRHPRVAFTHSNPGAVRSPLFTRSPSWILRIMGYIRAPLIYMTSISEDQSGEYMMYSMYRSQAGFVCVGQRGDVVQGPQYNDEEIDRMWDYVYNRPSVPYPQ